MQILFLFNALCLPVSDHPWTILLQFALDVFTFFPWCLWNRICPPNFLFNVSIPSVPSPTQPYSFKFFILLVNFCLLLFWVFCYHYCCLSVCLESIPPMGPQDFLVIERGIKLILSTTNWHLPSTSSRIKSGAATAADLQHPLKGVQGGDQEWDTVLWEKLAEQVFR